MTGGGGDKRDRPAWLGTPAADTIFTVARNRVYLQKKVLPPPAAGAGGKGKQREMSVDGFEIPDDLGDEDWYGSGPTAEEEEMLRELEDLEAARVASLASASAAASTSSTSTSASAAMLPPNRRRLRLRRNSGREVDGSLPVLRRCWKSSQSGCCSRMYWTRLRRRCIGRIMILVRPPPPFPPSPFLLSAAIY
jgi:hypothetical protein